jgi:Na+/proline symporter
MNILDWSILLFTLAFIVIYGIYKTRSQRNLNDYFRGDSKSPWWLIGVSVMATQASAITFISTPGQAFDDGMRFIQFYFGLPIAIIVICIWFIPIFHKLKVFTAYQFLEERFDLKTRTLAASLFLVQRGLAAGITIYAPSIILSSFLGWDLTYTNIGIGILVILYTVSGGTRAVSQTQKQQMFVIMCGMGIAYYLALDGIPESFNFSDKWQVAKNAGKINLIDLTLDPNNRYNLWSGLAGGFFLALSYFGTDQSQVARYLSGKNLREMRLGLIFNGILKIPMQFFILLCGVMVFVLLQFTGSPAFFNEKVLGQAKATEYSAKIETSETRVLNIQKQIQTTLSSPNYNEVEYQNLVANERLARKELKEQISTAIPGAETKDSDYVFLHFIAKYLPHGLIGLLIAVILSAAMSSTSSEINALASTTMIDIYGRFKTGETSDAQKVKQSKLFTLMWGVLAIIFALSAKLFDNLIEAVNILGSLFYGSILGIFLVAFWLKKVQGSAVFYAALIAEAVVITLFIVSDLGFLWFNFIGCALVMLLAFIFHLAGGKKRI